MRFTESPFITLSSLMIFGILLFDFIGETHYVVLALGGLLTTIAGALLLIRNKWTVWLLFACFTLLGGLLISLKRGEQNLHPVNMQSVVMDVAERRSSRSDWNQYLCDVKYVHVAKWLERSSERIVIMSQEDMNPGDRILATIKLDSIRNKGNPGEFDLVKYWDAKNIRFQGFLDGMHYRLIDHRSSFKQLFSTIRSWSRGVLESFLPKEVQGTAIAILLGDKGGLEGATVQIFQDAGAMHVLAVSGLHVGIVMLMLNFLLQHASKWISKRTALIITLLLTFIYAGMTGFSPSVTRAFLMFGVLLIGTLMGWRSSNYNALGFAAFIILLIDPLSIYDLGFQLSFTAMLGIFIFYQKVERWFNIRNKWLRKMWQGTAVGIAAQITTLPLVLYHFHQFANYFWLSNLLVMIFAGIILGAGIAMLIFGKVTYLAKGIGLLLGALLAFFLEGISVISNLPFAVASGFELNAFTVIALYLILIGFIAFRKKVIVRILGVATLVILSILQYSRFNNLVSGELIVFNSSNVVIGIRKGQDLLVLYEGKERHIKARRIAEEYNRLYRARLKMLRLTEDQVYHFQNLNVRITTKGDHLNLGVKGISYSLIRKLSDLKEVNGIPIRAAHLEYGSNDLSLSKGALSWALD